MASFADYVKDLMSVLPQVNGNPMLSVTSMTDDNARYREDPFYRSRDIQARDQLVLDEEERRRREAALSGSGIREGGEGGDGQAPGISPATGAYLAAENSTERGARNNALMAFLAGDKSAFSAMMGMTDSMGGITPGQLGFQASVYDSTPGWLQGMLPDSYGKSSGMMNQSNSIFGGMNPNGFASMGAQQAAALAAQDAGLFDSAAERAAWYADNAHDNGGGGGGWSTGGSVTDSGTGDNPNEGGYWG
jgi:hypothetical protein